MAEKKPRAPSKKLRKEFFKSFTDDSVGAVVAHLDGGVDANAMFSLHGDEPALAVALERSRAPKIARLLLDRGVDVKVAGPNGMTALHAVHDRAFAKELIDRGADVNAKTARGETPLHAAADNKLLPIVEELVARGADIDAVDEQGRSVYMHAKHAGIRAFLREKGAKSIGPGGGRVLAPTVIANAAKSDVNVDRGGIGVDREGNVWMGGYSGLFRWDGSELTCFKFAESFAFGDIVAGPHGVVYIRTNWGLLRYANDEWRLYGAEDSELFDQHLTFLTSAPDGRAYMVAYESEAPDRHVTIFDGETFSVLVPGVDIPTELELERIAFDARGELLLAGRGGYAQKQSGEWITTRKMDPASPFTSVVYDIVDDGEALWIGTQSGVYERRGETVTKHDTKNLAKHLLKDGDTLWVGTYFGGVARIRNGEVALYDEKNSALPHSYVQGLVRGRDGVIWVHANDKVAFIRDGEIHRFE